MHRPIDPSSPIPEPCKPEKGSNEKKSEQLEQSEQKKAQSKHEEL